MIGVLVAPQMSTDQESMIAAVIEVGVVAGMHMVTTDEYGMAQVGGTPMARDRVMREEQEMLTGLDDSSEEMQQIFHQIM